MIKKLIKALLELKDDLVVENVVKPVLKEVICSVKDYRDNKEKTDIEQKIKEKESEESNCSNTNNAIILTSQKTVNGDVIVENRKIPFIVKNIVDGRNAEEERKRLVERYKELSIPKSTKVDNDGWVNFELQNELQRERSKSQIERETHDNIERAYQMKLEKERRAKELAIKLLDEISVHKRLKKPFIKNIIYQKQNKINTSQYPGSLLSISVNDSFQNNYKPHKNNFHSNVICNPYCSDISNGMLSFTEIKPKIKDQIKVSRKLIRQCTEGNVCKLGKKVVQSGMFTGRRVDVRNNKKKGKRKN